MSGQVLVRSATPTDVRFAKREIDVLAVPYDTPTDIVDSQGVYSETIAPGAFGRVGSRASSVKVLRDHHPHRVIGKCGSIDGDGVAGLTATLSISPTELGNETLVLAQDGVLDVSIGFQSKGGDRWNAERSSVVRTNLHLLELSLVPMPAYDTAKVLAVRQGDEMVPVEMWIEPQPSCDTPVLNDIRAWLLEFRYGPH